MKKRMIILLILTTALLGAGAILVYSVLVDYDLSNVSFSSFDTAEPIVFTNSNTTENTSFLLEFTVDNSFEDAIFNFSDTLNMHAFSQVDVVSGTLDGTFSVNGDSVTYTGLMPAGTYQLALAGTLVIPKNYEGMGSLEIDSISYGSQSETILVSENMYHEVYVKSYVDIVIGALSIQNFSFDITNMPNGEFLLDPTIEQVDLKIEFDVFYTGGKGSAYNSVYLSFLNPINPSFFSYLNGDYVYKPLGEAEEGPFTIGDNFGYDGILLKTSGQQSTSEETHFIVNYSLGIEEALFLAEDPVINLGYVSIALSTGGNGGNPVLVYDLPQSEIASSNISIKSTNGNFGGGMHTALYGETAGEKKAYASLTLPAQSDLNLNNVTITLELVDKETSLLVESVAFGLRNDSSPSLQVTGNDIIVTNYVKDNLLIINLDIIFSDNAIYQGKEYILNLKSDELESRKIQLYDSNIVIHKISQLQ